ncbi:hypothetical protein B0I08_104275 [Glaciihabitans tibetensis]|uniref:DUF4352 domain-containing protein n=1 Tax=Glaciihabitans tibetensis TaxID=1266600 RepID=A0A2T0VEN2_9MICO|nr:hypothetical protein [Glaciihabitans tibetensis]PRY68572.1 hypothetical protein B0I08_104275 [Glaciihabitans tibetensis]
MTARRLANRHHRLRPRSRNQHWLGQVGHAAGFIALLVAAAVVTETTPSNEFWQGPIPVPGEINETLTGRNIEATVSEVRVARSVRADTGWLGETSGIWVVVDVSVAAVVDDNRAVLGTAELEIGSVVYSASTRPATASLALKPLATGIPRRGTLVFEIPETVLESEAAGDTHIHLAANGDPRSDSLIVVPVDLTAVTVEDTLAIESPEWDAR